MSKFAKLFDLEDGGQVLYTLESDEREDIMGIRSRTEIDDLVIEVTGWVVQSEALALLENITVKDALRFYDGAKKQIQEA